MTLRLFKTVDGCMSDPSKVVRFWRILHVYDRIFDKSKQHRLNYTYVGCQPMDGFDTFEAPRHQNDRNEDIEMGIQRSMHSGELGLDDFFKQVHQIEKQYEKLEKLLKKLQQGQFPDFCDRFGQALKDLVVYSIGGVEVDDFLKRLSTDAHEESKAITKAAAMKAIKQRMEKDVDEVSRVARFIKSKIEELDKENLANRSKSGCGKGSAVDRSRTATTVSLKKKFKDKMSEFQTLRENIHQEYREVVERRVYTVTGNRADEETIDRLIETGDSEQIFQKAIREQGRGQIMDTLAEIQERHDAVRELERKLLELQQIFLDMAVLVDAQGDMLDNIESQVSAAVDHVQSGNTALQKAKSLQRNSRKWMCIAIIILLMIVAVIVVGVLKPWNSNKGA
ncbi:hypothetical protein HAX54_019040 [Datura stramonium]|uniref:t-SNARE coiled-coil homology domain-containing protein n=1 Tax=Datura stramonium TaxID=4076 RepID=A0ABS8S3S0_DATST|nr:hypothetical protein [Datura stramonium]